MSFCLLVAPVCALHPRQLSVILCTNPNRILLDTESQTENQSPTVTPKHSIRSHYSAFCLFHGEVDFYSAVVHSAVFLLHSSSLSKALTTTTRCFFTFTASTKDQDFATALPRKGSQPQRLGGTFCSEGTAQA